MKITNSSSLREIALIVCTSLDEAGITAVLSGGGAATVYAPEVYQSRDADFIVQFRSKSASAADVLMKLGYEEKSQMYVHPNNTYTVEFPPGPLAIGRRIITEYATLTEKGFMLNILTSSDCVCDRLCGFYFWNDRSSLDAATGVANSVDVDLDYVRDWSESEGYIEKFQQFFSRLT